MAVMMKGSRLMSTFFFGGDFSGEANRDRLPELLWDVQPLAGCLPSCAAHDSVGGIWSRAVDELKAMSTVPLWHRPPSAHFTSITQKRMQEDG